MALSSNVLPFGLRDIRLTPFNPDESLGTGVDLPAARTMSFGEAEDFEELRGDDGVVSIHGKGPQVEVSFEAGGISLDAYRVMAGGTVTVTGVTPNLKKTFKKVKTDVKPWFKAEGQAISDSGGDFHGVIYKVRISESLEGELADGAFWLTSAEGKGIPNLTGDLYDFVQNETAVAIP